jgi:alcohol dehydrogenase class IV
MPMVPHGQAVAVTAPPVFPAAQERHLRAAELISGHRFTSTDGADALPAVLRDLLTDVGIPQHLRDFGYSPDQVDDLADGTLKQTRQLALVPRQVDREALRGTFTAAM